jgi:hypothetical protein
MPMKKKIKIPIYATEKEPEDYTPFSMVFASVWKAYDAGELNPTKLLIFIILYREVNPYNGIGFISYAEVCLNLKQKPIDKNINAINKLVLELRDEHHLIWFPEHSGSREFPYVIAKFKLASIDKKNNDKWIDIESYFQNKDKSESRANEITPTNPLLEPVPRQPPPEQRSERSNSEEITSIKEDIRKRYGRPPQTNTES